VISGAAVCVGADETGKAWTLNENDVTSPLQAKIKANFLDIGKTPLRSPHGAKLSRACVNALIAAGDVSKNYVTCRRADKRAPDPVFAAEIMIIPSTVL
jgi:hypothetical protein